MKRTVLTVISIFTVYHLAAQNVYWQQQVNYKINVELDDKKHFLHGYEEIEYINNSPDDLDFLYFHLWPNAYKNNKTAFARQQMNSGDTEFYFAAEGRRGYIDSLDFKVNGEKVSCEPDPEHIDICKIILPKPLKSGGKIVVSTPFRVKIPYTFSRLGHVGQQYQITQWYPKPAVYDHEGWHPMPYLDIGEFYSEFGSFDVSITLPENYVVGATGNLQNDEEKQFLDSIASEDWQQALFRYSAPQQASDSAKKTLRYLQDNVHDFAWFADKRYRVMQGEVDLPHSGRKVKLMALYNDYSYELWQNVIEYMHDAVYYYSLWIGDYPYDVVTVVDGALGAGGGMEYPTITVLGASSKFLLENVTMHEIGHNWFYGTLATNERDFAWMDEGMNSYYERRYIKTKYPGRKIAEFVPGLLESSSLARWIAEKTGIADVNYTDLYRIAYLMQARQNLDQPLNLHADLFTSANYFAMVYQKPAMMFRHLESYLGTEAFDRIMQRYYDEWKFKHPYPRDLRRIFEEESGKNLGWFFDGLIATKEKIDYKISSVKSDGGELQATVKNKGEIESPFLIATFEGDQRIEEKWVDGFSGSGTVTFAGSANADKLMIDPDTVTLDLYRSNGRSRTEGFLKNSEPLAIQFPGALEDADKNQLFVLPAFGLNTSDKFMLGAILYNRLFPQKKFNYTVMPMYSFGLEKLAGSAELNYNLYPTSVFRRIKLTGLVKSFAGYRKIEPSLELTFNPASLKYSPVQRLLFRYSWIGIDRQVLPLYEGHYEVAEGRYSLEKGNGLLTYGFNSGLRTKKGDFLSWDNELNVAWKYANKTYLRARVFYGRFLSGDNIAPGFRYGMSGSFDYQMDDIFFDRAMISDSYPAFERQTNLRDGGFRGFVPVSSGSYLAAVNLDAGIPQFGLFTLFADFGYSGDESGLFYDAGVRVNLIRNVLEFNFPIFGDPFEKGSPETFNDFTSHLTFRLRLDNLNPFKALYE